MTLTPLKAKDLPVEFKRLNSKPLNEIAQGIFNSKNHVLFFEKS